MKKLFTLSFCLSIILSELPAQTKYWVTFTDKNGGNPYTINNPYAFVTVKSIARRNAQGILFNNTDVPVTPSYISQVDAVPSVTVLFASKWINGVVVSITNTTAINTINALPFVSGSSVVNKYKLDIEKPVEEPVVLQGRAEAVTTPSAYYGGSYWQNKQLGVECLHSWGYRGQGMTIAVLDAGFSNADVNPVFDSLRNRGGILGTRDFVAGGNSVYEDDQHGSMVLSCMAAIKPNVILGSAPRADYWLLRTEDAATEKLIEEYNWIRGAEFADSVGVDILTTSLGYTTFDNPAQNHTFAQLDGKTSKMSIAANLAARKGMFVLNSAGNGNGGSWPKIGIPADADSICTVGAIDSLYNVTSFSSLGPTADGRIKPDLVARGGKSWVSFPNGSCGYSNGTSFSCPILAGAVACFWQAHKSYSCIKVLDTLRHTASFSLTPNNSRGWGTTNMCSIPPEIIIPAGVKQLTNNIDVSISPNPTGSVIRINYNATVSRIRILNMLGQQLVNLELKDKKDEITIDLSSFPNGVYSVEVSSFGIKSIKKVIKQ